MTPLQQVRANIDDYPQVGFTVEHSNGGLQLFQLNARNFWDMTVKDSADVEVASESYEVFPQSGQVKGTFPEGDLMFEYTHAGFTDAELTHYLTVNGDSVSKASLACIKILLASSAKRFDYKAGIKDIKASQVFDHLKELHNQLLAQVESEDVSSALGGVVITREHPAYQVQLDRPIDVSRGYL